MTREIKVTIEKAGPQGIQGDQGATGEGVPAGGTTDQILSKASDNDYDTNWVDNSSDSAKQLVNDNSVLGLDFSGVDTYIRLEAPLDYTGQAIFNGNFIGAQIVAAVKFDSDNADIRLVTGTEGGGEVVGHIEQDQDGNISISADNNQGVTFKTSTDAQNNVAIRGETGGGDDVQLRIQVEPGDGNTQIINEGSIAGSLTIQTPDNLELQSNNGNLTLNCNNGDILFNTFIGSDIQFIDDKQIQFGEFSSDSGLVWNKPGGDTMSIKSNDEVITINGQNSNQLTVQHIAQQDQDNQLSLNSSTASGNLSINLNCNPASGRPQLTGDGNLLSGFDIISNNQELKLTATNGNNVEISDDSKFSMGEFFNGGKFLKVRLAETGIDCNSGSNEVTINLLDNIQGGWNFNNMYRIKAVGINNQTEITLDAPSNVSCRIYGGDNSDTDIISNVNTASGSGAYNLPDFFNQGSFSNIGLYSDTGNFTGGTIDIYAIVEYLGE